jgi:hypothetical protein
MNTLLEPTGVVTILIDTKSPVQLGDLAASLSSYQDEYSRFFTAEYPDRDAAEAHLVVTDVRQGSIIVEVMPALLPLAIDHLEQIKVAVGYVKRIKALIDPWLTPGGRNPDVTAKELDTFYRAVKAVAKDSDGKLDVKARYLKRDGTSETRSEFVISSEQAKTITANIEAERIERRREGNEDHAQVVMTLHQASLDEARVGKAAGEKGVIESISDRPLKLLYASDEAGRRIKSEVRQDGNPLRKLFVVSVNVQNANGKPVAYRITEVHSVEDMPED